MSALVERAGGNPLFVRELVWAARHGERSTTLPDTVERVLTLGSTRSSRSTGVVLRYAAVVGPSFDLALLREIVADALGESLADDADDSSSSRHPCASSSSTQATAVRLPPRPRPRDRVRRPLVRPPRPYPRSRRPAIERRPGRAPTRRRRSCRSTSTRHATSRARGATRSPPGGGRRRASRTSSRPSCTSARSRRPAPSTSSTRRRRARRGGPRGRLRALRRLRARRGRLRARPRARSGRPGPRDAHRLEAGLAREHAGRHQEAIDAYELGPRPPCKAPRERRADAESDRPRARIAGVHYRLGQFADALTWGSGPRSGAPDDDRGRLAHAYYLLANYDLGHPDGIRYLRARGADLRRAGDFRGKGNSLNNLGIRFYYEGRWERRSGVRRRARGAQGAAGT